MRANRSSVSALIGAAFVALVAVVLTANAAFAAVNNTTTRSNTQHNITVQNPVNCPKGEVLATNPATGKQECMMPEAINYNASKSNTGGGEGPCPTCAKCVNPKGC